MNENSESTPSKPHISLRVMSFGGAAACFAATITLAILRPPDLFQSTALYLFVIGLSILVTAGLLFEFIAFHVLRQDAETVGVCFCVAGYVTVIAAIATLLTGIHWTYDLAFLLPLIVGFFTIKIVFRKHKV